MAREEPKGIGAGPSMPKTRHQKPRVVGYCTCGHLAEDHRAIEDGWCFCWGHLPDGRAPCKCKWLTVLEDFVEMTSEQ